MGLEEKSLHWIGRDPAGYLWKEEQGTLTVKEQ